MIGLGVNMPLGGRLTATPLSALCLLVAGPAETAAEEEMGAAAAENAAPSLGADQGGGGAAGGEKSATGGFRHKKYPHNKQMAGFPQSDEEEEVHDASREPLAALSQSDCVDTQRASQSQSQSQNSSQPAGALPAGSCPPAAAPGADPQDAAAAAATLGDAAVAVKEELVDLTEEAPKPKGREKAKVRQSRMLRELEFSSPGPGMISAKGKHPSNLPLLVIARICS